MQIIHGTPGRTILGGAVAVVALSFGLAACKAAPPGATGSTDGKSTTTTAPTRTTGAPSSSTKSTAAGQASACMKLISTITGFATNPPTSSPSAAKNAINKLQAEANHTSSKVQTAVQAVIKDVQSGASSGNLNVQKLATDAMNVVSACSSGG
jgi:hypothetical protein